MSSGRVYRQVVLLASAQALFQTASVMVMTVGGLAGALVAVTPTYSAAEAGRAQATNDMTIFVVGLVASLGAGALLEAAGWQTLNMLLLSWLVAAAAVLIGLGWRRRRAAARDDDGATVAS